MLRLFSSIRKSLLAENKTVKYAKYAVGEFLLIVAGILVALQVQTWYEGRKNAVLLESYLERLESDIQSDIEHKTNSLNFNSQKGDLVDFLLEVAQNPAAIQGRSVEFLAAITHSPIYSEGPLFTATFEELKSTGTFQLIDDELKSLLNNYYRQDESFRQFTQLRLDSSAEYYRTSNGILSLEQEAFLHDNRSEWNFFKDGALERMRSMTYDEGETLEALKRFLENKDSIAKLPRLKTRAWLSTRNDTRRLESAEEILEALRERKKH